MINNIKIEICLGNIQDVKTLEKYDIDRIELNSALELGGLTPSISTLIEAKKVSSKKIVCMCRCRGGNFAYTEDEYKTMFLDAENMLKNGADGIVFGFLNNDNTINIEKTKQMAELIHRYNKEAVFHKAFDELDDLDLGCKILCDLHIDRILTSGKAVYPDILLGCTVINELHNKYPNIQLLPGGGVRINNIKDVIGTTKTGQVHMTSKKTYDGNYIGLDEIQLKELLQQIQDIKE